MTRGRIGTRYELGDEIARGGMGRVVEATDTVLGRSVAIKEALTTEPEMLERFAREIRLTARLDHPSIVSVHDAGTLADGAPFYVMRKVTGQPLEQLVVAARTLPQRLALLPNVLAAANAVAHAHHRGVVHRDLKPANILVGRLGETVVIDWGLAKLVDEPDDTIDPFVSLRGEGVGTRHGAVIGTPGFMSPEQLRGGSVDARSDVYALGATLYFVFARRPPHTGANGDEMMAAGLAGPPPPVAGAVPGLPRELATIVDKALAYEVADRYHDAGGLAQDLERFLEGQLVASHRYSPRERALRFLRRHRVAVTVGAVAAAALAVGGAIAIAKIVSERDRADAALRDALERNDALELAHAQSLLASNPTAAIARIKPIATAHWREARTLALAARAAGVARGLPGPHRPRSVDLSHDGATALVAGDDGRVYYEAIATGAASVALELAGSARAAFVDADRSIVAWTAKRLVVAGTLGRREHALAAEIAELRTAGDIVWWCDASGAAWSYPLTTAPYRIEVADRIAHVAAHGTIHTIAALGGEHRLWLVRDGKAAAAAEGAVRALAWSGSGKLAAIAGDRVVVLDPAGAQTEGSYPGARSLVWQGDDLYIGATGTVTRFGDRPIAVGDTPVIALYAGPRESLIARSNTNTLFVLGPHVLVELPPTSALHVATAAPSSRYLIAGSDDVVLAWNLDDVLPSEIPIGRPMTHVFGAMRLEQLVIAHDEHSATWVDVPSGAHDELELGGLLVETEFAPDRRSVLLVTQGGAAGIYTRGRRTGAPIEPRVRNAAFATPARLVIGTPAKDLVLYDVASRATTTLYTSAATAYSTQVRGDWAAVLFDDSSLWRRNLVTGATTTLPPAPERYMVLRDGGEVAVTDRERLAVWRADGRLEAMPALPVPVTHVMRVDDHHVLVYTGGDSAHVAELDGARRATMRFPPGSRMIDLAIDGPLGVYADDGNRIYVTDPLAGTTWRIGKPLTTPLEKPGISADGARVFAISGASVVVWHQPVPQTREATLALIESLTNARTHGDSDALIWR